MMLALSLSFVGCNPGGTLGDAASDGGQSDAVTDVPSAPSDAPNAPLVVTSTAFTMNMSIPPRHALTGCGVNAMNLSPPLAWTGAPAGTQSFAIIFEDIDVPDSFIHWIAWNIPATTTSLPEGVMANTPDFVNGFSDLRRRGYGGPCAPPPERHRYVFNVYALDVASIALQGGATIADLRPELEGHVLAQGRLVGQYRQ